MAKKKVVITFCEAGQGHIVTAQSIAESLERKYGDKIEVVSDYVFRDSNDKTLIWYENFSIQEVYRANKNKFHLVAMFVAMKVFGEMLSLKFIYSTLLGKVKRKLMKIYSKMDADMIVSTHFAPYHIACCAKKKGIINASVVAYNPDHNVHGWWDRRGDLFFVNNPFAEKEAVKDKKFNPDVVKKVNFMARRQIVEANGTKEYYREKLGIPQDKFAVILADGAYAAARMQDFTDELLKTDLPLTIVAVCGKNEQALKKYTELKDIKPNITFIPLPFVSHIEEYYKACDLFITKAGPNAITDCVFMGTPVMTNFYSGEIEKTSSYLFMDYYKAGLYEPDKFKAREKVEQFISNPSLLDEYRENTKVLDKTKNGADEIADMIADYLFNGKN